MGRGDDEVNCLNYRDLGDAIEGMLNSNKRLFSSLLHELEKGRDLKFKVLPPPPLSSSSSSFSSPPFLLF